MAADTIKLPGGGNVSRRALWIAGAVGVGVVGYAYMTRRPKIPSEVVTEGELDKLGDERIPTTGVPYDPNIGSTTGIVDNASWARFATDRMLALGYDITAVSDALGKFLDRKPLTPSEANLVRAAIGQAGEPPQGRPWPVTLEQAPASVGLLAPTGLAVHWVGWSGNVPMYRLTWEPVQGAADYHVIQPNGSSGFVAGTSLDNVPGVPLQAGKARVAGRNAAHVVGPYAEVSWTPGPLPAAPAPAPAPPGPAPAPAPAPAGSPPPPVTTLGVLPVGPGRVGLSFPPEYHGATYHLYRWETASEVSPWALAPSSTFEVTWLFPRGTQFTANVVACNAHGCSGGVQHSNVAVAH